MSAGLVALLLLVGGEPADALPRFGARTGQSCATCHVDPLGSGPRTHYGAAVYAPLELPMALGELGVGARPELDFGEDRSAAVGADLRLLYAYVEGSDAPADQGLNSFFPMQADLYLSAQLGDHLTFVLDRGITNFSAYGMVHLQHRRAWLKAGHFVMPYGLRLADHTAFVRERLGFSPQTAYYGLDTGLEVGWRPGDFTLAVAVANGKPVTGAPPVQFDDNDAKALYALAEYRFGPQWLPLRVGVSGYTNTSGRKVVGEEDGEATLLREDRLRRRQAGVFLTASVDRFTYLGEVDVLRTTEYVTDAQTLDTTTDSVDGYALFNELSFLIIQGLDLQVQFEVDRPDVDADLTPARRIGAGFEAFPLPMLETKLLYRRTLSGQRDGLDELAAVLHVYL
jgi:hypothetical protein